MAVCKSCQAEIKFIRTAKNQRQMPVNLPAITVITESGQVRKAYTPHWPNCSGAETFRSKTLGTEKGGNAA